MQPSIATVSAWSLLLGLLGASPVAAAPATALESGGWELVEYRVDDRLQAPTASRPAPILRFAAGHLSGSTGCNRLVGAYAAQGDELQIKPNMATTALACPEPLMAQEQAVVAALDRVARFDIADDELRLRDADDRRLLVLSRRTELPLTGTRWRLTAYDAGGQGLRPVLADSDFMLQLRADGQLAGRACNTYRGGYARDGSTLRLVGPIAATRMACPEPAGIMVQEAAYFDALEQVVAYRLQGSQLTLLDAAGAPLARFEAADATD